MEGDFICITIQRQDPTHLNLWQSHCLHPTASLVPRCIIKADILSCMRKDSLTLATQSSHLAIVPNHATKLFTKQSICCSYLVEVRNEIYSLSLKSGKLYPIVLMAPTTKIQLRSTMTFFNPERSSFIIIMFFSF